MHVPSATRVLAALLLLLPACPTSYATNPCVGHRNVIEGVATSETVADTVVSNTTANINGCGNVVAGNTLAVGKVVIVQGSDNIVESNVQTRADKDLRVVGNNNAVVGNVGDYVAVVLNSNDNIVMNNTAATYVYVQNATNGYLVGNNASRLGITEYSSESNVVENNDADYLYFEMTARNEIQNNTVVGGGVKVEFASDNTALNNTLTKLKINHTANATLTNNVGTVFEVSSDSNLVLDGVVQDRGTTDAGGKASLSLALLGALPPPGLYTLRAVSTSAAWQQAANVTLVGRAPLVAVVLDKTLYRPGETVQIRALSLGTDLLPLAGAQVSLSVRDPNGFLVAATSATADSFGVVSWGVPTSAEPVLGQWTVAAASTGVAGNATAERGFELARYLLPTFAVQVTPSAPYLLYTRDRNADGTVTLAGSLTATHTNGAPVAGTVLLAVLQPVTFYSSGMWGRPIMGAAVDAVAGKMASPAAAGDAALPTVPIVASSDDGSGSGGATSASLLGTLALATSAAGSASFSVKVPAAGLTWDGASLMLLATVTETATGEAQNGTSRVPVSSTPMAATLTADPNFMPGLPWRVTLALTLPDGTPAGAVQAPRAALAASATRRSGAPALSVSSVVTLDATGTGTATFTVPADDLSCCNRTAGQEWQASQTSCCVDYISVSLNGIADVSAYAGASVRAGAVAGAFAAVGPLTPATAIAPGSSVSFTPAATTAGAPLRWALLGPKGAVAAGSATAGVAVSVTVPASAGSSPSLLLWYQTAGGSLVFDYATLSIVASLPQSLSASFGAATAQPGDDVTVSASGAPSCRVFFAATDVSVALLDADAALTAAGVTAAAADALQTAADAADAAATTAGAQVGSCYNPPPHQAAGAAVLTAATLPSCENMWFGGGGGVAMMEAMPAMAAMDMAAGDASKMSSGDSAARTASPGDGGGGVRVRSLFPETWLWATADADGAGAASLQATAPDTLTSWQLAAFSVHPTLGVAVAPQPATLAVSQPFYMRAAPPLALVRGEQVLLRLGLFSNMSVAVNATVTLVDAAGSGFELAGDASASAQLPPGGAAGVAFALTPRRFGALQLQLRGEARDAAGNVAGADALQAPLTVVAEGIPAEVTQNALLRLGGAGTTAADAAASLSAPAPANAVAGSARATLSVIGDLMGQTLAGLGALLQVPSGCGEQNMIGMAPNVAVLEYLAAAPNSSPPPQLAAAAAANAAIGFQRELTYRHADGSFSAFGESDGSGSTWLTAFVLKVLSDAARFVAIDDTVLASAATWLLAKQDATSGVFMSVGSVIHTDMVGGATSDVSMTGFVLLALLAAPPAAGVTLPPLAAAASYLASHPAASGDAYAAHLRAYALATSCSLRQLRCSDAETAATGIKSAMVSTAGALRHWEAPRAAPAPDVYWQAPPADIELTGYGVLTLLSQGRTADASEPARWLVAQRGAGGGFASTQDTVVGLAALSRFAAATYAAPPALSLAVSGQGVMAGTSMVVDAAKASLLQQLDVPPGTTISVAGTGAGTALVQLTTRYNVLPAPAAVAGSGAGFAVSVSAVNVTGAGLRRRRLLDDGASAAASLVHVKACAQRAASASAARQAGMVILEAGLFSGYAPVAASLAAVQASAPALVKRVEVDLPARRVLFYLDSLPSGDAVCLQFDTVQSSDVFGLAPAASRAYSYYAPADAGAASLAVDAVTAAATRPTSGVSGPPALLGGPGLAGGRSPSGAARAATAAAWATAAAAGVCLLSCAGVDLGLPKMHAV